MLAYHDDTLTKADNSRFIRAAMAAPMLERDDEAGLARAWRDRHDEAALHKIIKSHVRLVIAMAAKFRGYGLPMGDLIQEGHIGLLQAANRFDTGREVRFSTYAAWWIRASMQDYILRNWSIVRAGSTASQKALFFGLRRLRAQIEGKERARGNLDTIHLTRETRKEIARALKVQEKDVEAMDMRLAASDQSLQQLAHEESTTEIGDFLVDDAPTPEDYVMTAYDSAVHHMWLEKGLADLDTRERAIIKARHLRDTAATLEDLGVKLNISKERVRQLETRALAKLRRSVEARASA
jgi:RNA polymerase sigma-32 factor